MIEKKCWVIILGPNHPKQFGYDNKEKKVIGSWFEVEMNKLCKKYIHRLRQSFD